MNTEQIIELIEDLRKRQRNMTPEGIDLQLCETKNRVIESLESRLTVRRAFELAGHSVPEGARITWYQGNDHWMWLTDTEHCGFFAVCWSAPMPTSMKDAIPAYSHPNLANLPASDCYDALPEVVRQAISKEVVL